LQAIGYDEDLDTVLDADMVAGMLAAVEGIVGGKKPTIKKFKRELVKLCGKGETFSVSRVDLHPRGPLAEGS
jgi:hypothetical protein